mgnify:CR=1 FL=1
MTATFESLGLDADICEALAARGIENAFPIQEMTIPDILEGRDVCGKARTGSGKTLAFGLPIIQLLERGDSDQPSALALVPTRELATQVRDELTAATKSRGLRIAAIYGGDPIEKQIKLLRDGVDFAVCTPGRAIDLIERGELTVTGVSKVVIDEADRMADMGVLPQVEWILRTVVGKHQTLLFSATLDGVVDSLIRRYQHDPARHEVQSKGPSVENMTHVFLQVHEMDKAKVTASIIRGADRTMVFSATKHGADRLARKLSEQGVEARAIHGDGRAGSHAFQERRIHLDRQATEARDVLGVHHRPHGLDDSREHQSILSSVSKVSSPRRSGSVASRHWAPGTTSGKAGTAFGPRMVGATKR